MRRFLCVFVMLFLSTAGMAETWVSNSRSHYLIDEATGKPLITLSDGRPEVFSSMKDSPFLIGAHTEARFEREELLSGEKFPPLNSGERYKIRGKEQWVLVQECCQDYSWVKAQSLPGWTDYFRDITGWLENFGFSPDGFPVKLDFLDACFPLVNTPVFLYDPKTLRPRWSKLYAVARKQYDGTFRGCIEREAYVHSNASLDSTNDEETVAISVPDVSPIYGRTLIVSARTGQIVDSNPGGFKAIDVFELLQYKDEFLRKNPCPLLDGADKARYTALQEASEKRVFATKTKAGRCYLDRLKRYERDVIHQFLGVPTEPLQ